MPNHCSQDLFVYGKEIFVIDFMEFSQEGLEVLSANKYIPYPENFKKMDEMAALAREQGNYIKDGFNSGGYQWCIDNWGTKWGIYRSNLVSYKLAGSRSRATYYFESAWSPPIPVIHKMSDKYPAVRFLLKYYERGAQFKGIFEIKGGKILRDLKEDYHGHRGG